MNVGPERRDGQKEVTWANQSKRNREGNRAAVSVGLLTVDRPSVHGHAHPLRDPEARHRRLVVHHFAPCPPTQPGPFTRCTRLSWSEAALIPVLRLLQGGGSASTLRARRTTSVELEQRRSSHPPHPPHSPFPLRDSGALRHRLVGTGSSAPALRHRLFDTANGASPDDPTARESGRRMSATSLAGLRARPSLRGFRVPLIARWPLVRRSASWGVGGWPGEWGGGRGRRGGGGAARGTGKGRKRLARRR
jgi:hypothetical protein